MCPAGWYPARYTEFAGNHSEGHPPTEKIVQPATVSAKDLEKRDGAFRQIVKIYSTL